LLSRDGPARSGLIEAAAKRGENITVWNRTLDKARALEQFGVTVAATPADAVRGRTACTWFSRMTPSSTT